MGTTSSKQVGIAKKEKQEKQSSFSRLSSNSDIDAHITYLDTALALHSNDIALLHYNCDNYIPNIKYGIIADIQSAKSFSILSPIKHETMNKHKICNFVLHLNKIIVTKEDAIVENEKQAAIKLKEIVKDILYGTRVHIENIQLNDDGRLFCDLKFSSDDHDIKEYLVYNNLGVSYGNESPSDWLEYIVKHHVHYKSVKSK